MLKCMPWISLHLRCINIERQHSYNFKISTKVVFAMDVNNWDPSHIFRCCLSQLVKMAMSQVVIITDEHTLTWRRNNAAILNWGHERTALVLWTQNDTSLCNCIYNSPATAHGQIRAPGACNWCHLGTKGQFRLQSLNVSRTDKMWLKAAVVLTLSGKCYVSAAKGRNKKDDWQKDENHVKKRHFKVT